jgi:hypothetical protein
MRLLAAFVFPLAATGCTCLLDEKPDADADADADTDIDTDADTDTDTGSGTDTGTGTGTDTETGTGTGCAGDDDCDPGVCDGAGDCVPCIDATDHGCEAPAPYCVDGACVECEDHADCVDPASPRCDGGACGPCVAGGEECGDDVCFEDLPTEQDDGLPAGRCLPCNVSADCDGGDACDPWTHTCAAPGSSSQCEACLADEDCTDPEARCVEVGFEGDLVGTYCALGGCDDEGDPEAFCFINTGRGNHCLASRTRAGEEGSWCIPRTTTCEGYLAQDDDCTADGAICSADGAGGMNDASCVFVGAGCDKCTYSCDDSNDCPGGRSCSGGRCGTTGC